MRGDSGILHGHGILGIADKGELGVPADIKPLRFVEKELPFIGGSTGFPGLHGSGNVLDACDLGDTVACHVQLYLKAVVFRMPGNRLTIEVFRTKALSIKGRIHTKMARAGRSDT